MPQDIRGYAAQSAAAPLAPHSFERRDPRPDDVVVDILYCGVCHSDLHTARNEWHGTRYPVVPGHEIIGKVSAMGAEVSRFKVGDLVGVGCMVDSCQHCAACDQGLEQYCAEVPTFTYNSKDRHDGRMTYGGYSERIVVADKFVLRIDDKLDPKSAAPLLCAGITTWSPLRHWKVGKGSKVAVVGLGGLGHMGAEVRQGTGRRRDPVHPFAVQGGRSPQARCRPRGAVHQRGADESRRRPLRLHPRYGAAAA